jgi:hypothetical protein
LKWDKDDQLPTIHIQADDPLHSSLSHSVDVELKIIIPMANKIEKTIRCEIGGHPNDIKFWVDRKTFFNHVCDFDFKRRNCHKIVHKYHPGWFDNYPGLTFFSPPVVEILKSDGGILYEGCYANQVVFIGGRHRIALLSEYLDVLPVSLNFNRLDQEDIFSEIAIRRIAPGETIELPNLQFELAWPSG